MKRDITYYNITYQIRVECDKEPGIGKISPEEQEMIYRINFKRMLPELSVYSGIELRLISMDEVGTYINKEFDIDLNEYKPENIECRKNMLMP